MPSRISFLLLLFLVGASVATEQFPFSPKAPADAVVTVGGARFTVLTAHLIRMEYSNTGRWEDRATWAFLNRNLRVPSFTVSNSTSKKGFVSIKTAALELLYDEKAPAFTSESLSITLLQPVGGETVTWSPGQLNTGNLLGTIRSLDEIDGPISLNCTENANVTVHDEGLHCTWGLISREGWVVVDDVKGPYLDSDEWPSSELSSDVSDQYFFGHGHNYKLALSEYTQLGLKIPMVPKYMLGIAWTRWYSYTAAELSQIANDYLSRSLPLDTIIIDMDWHKTFPAGESKLADDYWTGYSFDPELIPYPQQELGLLKRRGLHVGVNIHDAKGVQWWEDTYAQMAAAHGIDPSSHEAVAFNVTNRNYMDSLEQIVTAPIWKAGVDFPWIDWQQGGSLGVHLPNVNPTYMLNYFRSTRQVRAGTDERGLILSRWGGLGNHRYQVGFSGDVVHDWKSLAFQPYFSATATNVGFGYWSHDIIGRGSDYELQTRWIQWGAFSSIFRTHDAGSSAGGCANNVDGPGDCSLGSCPPAEMWRVPNYNFEINRAATVLRSEMVPYLYTLMRIAYDEGLGPIRPMYYNFPEVSQAYDVPGQYNLGDLFIVNPVVVPGNKQTSLAAVSTWIPQGKWVDVEGGILIDAQSADGTMYQQNWDLSEIPRFVSGGAVIPTVTSQFVSGLGTAQRLYPALTWSIYPGASFGENKAYDDDGVTLKYSNNVNTWFGCEYDFIEETTVNILRVQLESVLIKDYPLRHRPYQVRAMLAHPPVKVTVNGTAYPFAIFDDHEYTPETWSYDPIELAVVVNLPAVNIQLYQQPFVNITFASTKATTLPSGMKGKIRRALLAKSELDEVRMERNSFSSLVWIAQAGHRLSLVAGDTVISHGIISSFTSTWHTALKEVSALQFDNPSRKARVMALLQSPSLFDLEH